MAASAGETEPEEEELLLEVHDHGHGTTSDVGSVIPALISITVSLRSPHEASSPSAPMLSVGGGLGASVHEKNRR